MQSLRNKSYIVQFKRQTVQTKPDFLKSEHIYMHTKYDRSVSISLHYTSFLHIIFCCLLLHSVL
jgi:hypothetical protein